MINKFLCLALILLSHTAVLLGGHELKQFSKIFSGYHCIPAIAEIIDGYVGTDDNCPKLDACTCDDGRGVDRKDCKCGADHDKMVINKCFYYKTDEHRFSPLIPRVKYTLPFIAGGTLSAALGLFPLTGGPLPTLWWATILRGCCELYVAGAGCCGLIITGSGIRSIWGSRINSCKIHKSTDTSPNYSCKIYFESRDYVFSFPLTLPMSDEKFLEKTPSRFPHDLNPIDYCSLLDDESPGSHNKRMIATSEDKTVKVVVSKGDPRVALYRRSPLTVASLVRTHNQHDQNVEKLRLANKWKAIAIVGGMASLTLLGIMNKHLVGA